MRKLRLGNLVKTLLAAVGALTSLAVITAAAIFAYQIYYPINQRDQATSKDVVHILNWASIPTDQRFKVLHSYRSARSFTGDHIDGHCISLERLALDDDWKTVDSLERPFLDAVTLALDSAREDLPCLPGTRGLATHKILVKPFTLRFFGTAPEAGEIVFLDPTSKELHFVDFKF